NSIPKQKQISCSSQFLSMNPGTCCGETWSSGCTQRMSNQFKPSSVELIRGISRGSNESLVLIESSVHPLDEYILSEFAHRTFSCATWEAFGIHLFQKSDKFLDAAERSSRLQPFEDLLWSADLICIDLTACRDRFDHRYAKMLAFPVLLRGAYVVSRCMCIHC